MSMSTWTRATCEEIAQYQREKHLICSLVRSSSQYYTAIIQYMSRYYACTSSTWWTSEHPGKHVSGIHTPFSSWYLRAITLHVLASWEAPTSLAHWNIQLLRNFFFFSSFYKQCRSGNVRLRRFLSNTHTVEWPMQQWTIVVLLLLFHLLCVSCKLSSPLSTT